MAGRKNASPLELSPGPRLSRMCKGEPDSFRYANEVSSKAFLLCFKKGGTTATIRPFHYERGFFIA